MTDGFEFFDPKNDSLCVSLAHYGMTFSKNAVESLKHAKHVALAIDRNRRLIGIKPTTEADEKSFEFVKKPEKNYVRINNKSFVRMVAAAFDIELKKKTVSYFARFDEASGMLIVELNKPLKSGTVAEMEKELENGALQEPVIKDAAATGGSDQLAS